MSIESIMAAVKRRRALLSKASDGLWLSDYELMTAEELENMHILKLNIKNECLAAKNRLARRMRNNQRGRICST